MPEHQEAIELADLVLADNSRDPDSDLSVLARQFMRERERSAWFQRTVRTARDMLRDTPASKYDVEQVLTVCLTKAQRS